MCDLLSQLLDVFAVRRRDDDGKWQGETMESRRSEGGVGWTLTHVHRYAGGGEGGTLKGNGKGDRGGGGVDIEEVCVPVPVRVCARVCCV